MPRAPSWACAARPITAGGARPRAASSGWRRAPAGRCGCGDRVGRRRWSKRCSGCARTFRCGAGPSWPCWCGPQGVTVSESTVGRILRHLVARGVVQPVPLLRRAKARLGRRRRPHARRLPKGQRADRPGALVQLDTPDHHPAAGHLDQAVHRLLPGRPLDGGQSHQPRHQHRCRQLPRQGAGRDAVPGHRAPGRRRLRIHGQLRDRLSGQGRRAVRPAAQVTQAQRRGRARQRQLALRVLCRLRPAGHA